MRSVPYGLAALADQDRARGNPLYKLLCLRKTRPVTGADEKQALHRYLRNARGVLLWKLEGLSGYDIRRPVTPTGTNLLGLVKHCGGGGVRVLRRGDGPAVSRRGRPGLA